VSNYSKQVRIFSFLKQLKWRLSLVKRPAGDRRWRILLASHLPIFSTYFVFSKKTFRGYVFKSPFRPLLIGEGSGLDGKHLQ